MNIYFGAFKSYIWNEILNYGTPKSPNVVSLLHNMVTNYKNIKF